MPEVAITIGPKTYKMLCGEGEQERIETLGALIAEKYAQLGADRAPLEAQNLLFTALFLADELSDARNKANDAAKASQSARAEVDSAMARVEQEKSKSGGKKAELKAEIETLRKAEARAREEVSALKAELVALREANEHQHDLFVAGVDEDALASSLEQMADRAEAAANAMEGALDAPKLEDPSDKA
ncbi:MAG: cell division protein ZapA [Pseudomonadota bacterium]